MSLGNPVLPLALVTVPASQNERPTAANDATLLLPVVLILILPHVAPLPLLHVPLPRPLVQVPVRITLLTLPVLFVGAPQPAVCVAVRFGELSEAIHST